MAFEPAQLPDRKWLKLSEVVNSLALEDTQDVTAMQAAGSPSDRTYSKKVEQAWTRCLDEAGTDPRYTAFVELVRKPGFWNGDPVSESLLACKHAWPPYGQAFYDLVVKWEGATADEIEKREVAKGLVEQWLASGEVNFEGYRDGCLERINVQRLDDIEVYWQFDSIRARSRDETSGRPQLGTSRPRSLEWSGVSIERASLMAWLHPAPDPMQFDPMQQAYWTLPMAVAWVRSKWADAVREQWDSWREQCAERRLGKDGYYYREPWSRASLTKLASIEDQKAWDTLRLALQKGKLSATLASTADTLPKSVWMCDDQGQRRTGIRKRRRPDKTAPDAADLEDVRLNVADVLHLWPMPVPEIIDIWRERKRWPHHAKYAFLGRAVGDVGRSLFPDEWTGEEPLSSPPDEPEHCSQPNAAAARFEKVMVEIASAALAEQLMVFTRSAKGGEMAASPAVHWNTEILRPRFQRGQIDLADPFEPNPSWRDRHWIFVSEESLAKFTKSLKSKPASSNQALRRARQYLQPIMASAKPAKMTRADLILQCAETQRARKSAARKAYEYLLPDADQSWRKMGRPPKLVG